MNDYQNDKSITFQLQEYVCDILNRSDLSVYGAVFYPENLLDIDYEIKNAISKQGLACIVMTPSMNYEGHNGLTQAYTAEDLTIQIVENPVVNRARLKKAGLSSGTALDICVMAAEKLAGPQSGHFGEFTTQRIEQGEDEHLIVAKTIFQTTVYQEISGIISSDLSGHRVDIPFVTHSEISGFVNELEDLSTLITGFDTEDIKERLGVAEDDIEDLYVKMLDLSAVYQPVGNYLKPDDLIPYALRSQVPHKTSQLENDAGFVNEVRWDDIYGKPDVALRSQIPTKTSQLVNDSITVDSINALSRNGGKVVGRLMVGNEDEAHIEMSPGDYESAAHIQIGEAFSAGGHLELNGTDSWIRINGADVATEDDLPKKTSDLVNDSKYISFGENTDQAGAVTIRAVGSTQYARISPGAFDIGSDPKPSAPFPGIGTSVYEGVINVTDQYDTGVLAVGSRVTVFSSPDEVFVQVDGNNLATESYVDEKARPVPENISYFKNDVGYISAHQDLSDYATKSWVDEQGYLTAHQDLTDYATKIWVDEQGYLTAHQDLAEYATNDDVTAKVNAEAVRRAAEDEDLAARIQQKPNFSDIPTRTSQLVNDSNFITAVPDLTEYYTKTESNARFQEKGNYLTAHQSLADYYKRAEADAVFQEKGNYLTAHQSLADYYTKQQVDAALSAPVKKLYAGNEQQYIDGNKLVWRDIDGEWVNTGILATKDELPRNTSDLVNDSGYISQVYWDDVRMKPELPTFADLNRTADRLSSALDSKLDRSEYDNTAIYGATGDQKITGDGEIYEAEIGPELWTDWEYDDGNEYPGPYIYNDGLRWWAAIDQDTYRTAEYETREEVQNLLDTALEISFSSGQTTIKATREYYPETKTWNKIDDVAKRSEISSYATTDEISAIAGKYTEDLSAQIRPELDRTAGGEWVTLSGLLEDDTPVVFQIFAKGI